MLADVSTHHTFAWRYRDEEKPSSLLKCLLKVMYANLIGLVCREIEKL
jgi:hypothetical protein